MTKRDPNWRTQRVKPTVLDYRHVDYYGDPAPTNRGNYDLRCRHRSWRVDLALMPEVA